MKRPVTQQQGFTLVELIMVIVLIGIIGGVLTMQLLPAIKSYLLVGQRAGLTHQSDTALRRIVTEVRSAVPNSLRLGSSECLELVPTKDGGRYRMAPDVAVSGAAYLDHTIGYSSFDVLTSFQDAPRAGDSIVIGNQNPDDVYQGRYTGKVKAVTTHGNPRLGESLVELNDPLRTPPGYEAGRFVVVPAEAHVVTYVCTNPGLDAQGTGTGELRRITDTAFHATPNCGAGNAGAVLASKVAACAFTYSPNQGATQESGFAQFQLTLSDKGEAVTLTVGAHVDNVP